MRFLRLHANKPSFRTVTFNRFGLSLVVAEQHAPRKDRTRTYNGVGKSLMLELLHYCLASNAKPTLVQHLEGWEFSLDLEVNGEAHTLSRTVEKKSKAKLDGTHIPLEQLREWLAAASFEIPDDFPDLSFRSLISKFIRSGAGAYTDFARSQLSDQNDPYGAMLRNAFLLGLDVRLASNKKRLRNRQEELGETMKQIERDPLFAELLAEDTVGVELTALQERAAELQTDLDAFTVANDYRDIELDADRLKRELTLSRRMVSKLNEAIAQIDRSLELHGDLSKERVYELYAEVKRELPSHVARRVDEVLQFQQNLQQRRIYRLNKERQLLDKQRADAEAQTNALSHDFDERVRYLGEHRALDEYVAVNQELSGIQQRIAKLEESSALRERVKAEQLRISRDLADQNIEAEEYLSSAKPLITEASHAFRAMTRALYGSRLSGLSIANDEGENTLRYKIEAHIAADAAEGINEAKIFCYDMTLFSLRRGHRMDCLVHDSTLFGPVDPRQRLAMFRVARDVASRLGTQYIATLNLHDITSIRDQVDIKQEELDELFGNESTVLRLADDKPESKLLGIDVDITYRS